MGANDRTQTFTEEVYSLCQTKFYPFYIEFLLKNNTCLYCEVSGEKTGEVVIH